MAKTMMTPTLFGAARTGISASRRRANFREYGTTLPEPSTAEDVNELAISVVRELRALDRNAAGCLAAERDFSGIHDRVGVTSDDRHLEATMDWIKQITNTVEPIQDQIYGPRYRCALTLKDGTFLPCAVIQSRDRLVDLAKRRIKEEMQGRGALGGDDPYGQIVSTFVTGGNRVNDYDVASASPSRFAIPLRLLGQIHGETTMGWAGWVFRMKDERLFAYGTTFAPCRSVLELGRWPWRRPLYERGVPEGHR